VDEEDEEVDVEDTDKLLLLLLLLLVELTPKRNMDNLFPPPHVSLEFPCPEN
jgi:hypothetical protein